MNEGGSAIGDSSYSVTVPKTVADEESGSNLYRFRLRCIRSEAVGLIGRTISSVTLDYYVDAAINSIGR